MFEVTYPAGPSGLALHGVIAMAKFGIVPIEVPVQRSLDICAPKFATAVRDMMITLEGGLPEWVFETVRTEARQSFLFGFGRQYDDGRGIVTKAATALNSWHAFGLAVDVVEKDNSPWDAPAKFWKDLGEAAEGTGRLIWGGRWTNPDRPHVQWSACPVSPTNADRLLFRNQGITAVWAKYGAL